MRSFLCGWLTVVLLTSFSSVSSAQPPGRSGSPRDRVRPRDVQFQQAFPLGTVLPDDLSLYNTDRKLVPVNTLFSGKYTVIVCGCLTCPAFRNSYPEIEAVARDFADKDVQFYFLYQALAHPENWGFVQPSSLNDRFAQADHAAELLRTTIPWLVDPMDNRMKLHFQSTPNSQFIFDGRGQVVHRESWGRGSSLRDALNSLIGTPATLTEVNDLNLPTFPRHRTGPGESLLQPIRPDSPMVPLQVTTTQTNDPLSPPSPSKGAPSAESYVKLRAEADRDLLITGTGQLYLGFRQDPVLGAKWNNLSEPPQFKVIAPLNTVSPDTGSFPRLQVETDTEAREVLLDVSNWKPDSPVTVKIQYIACDKENQWCKSLLQEFTVILTQDKLAGSVSARSGTRNGSRGRNRQRPQRN